MSDAHLDHLSYDHVLRQQARAQALRQQALRQPPATPPPNEKPRRDLEIVDGAEEVTQASEIMPVKAERVKAAPVRFTGDEVTTLRSTSAKFPLAKEWKNDGTVKGYSSPKSFKPESHRVANIHELSALLTEIESEPQVCIVRGRPRIEDMSQALVGDEAPPKAGHIYRRKAIFNDVAQHFVCIEVDDFEPITTDPVSDPVGAIEEFINSMLPAAFRDRSYHRQLSNSAGHPSKAGKLKVHVWFWLATPRTSAELKAWAESIALAADNSVFDPVQIHYTAAPVFEKGVLDPVPVRSGFVQRESDEVELDLTDVPVVIDQAHKTTRTERLSDAAENDPVARLLRERGMVKGGQDRNGGLHIECPNSAEHTTDSGNSATVYYPANTGGWVNGNVVCLHAHCRDKPRDFFLDLLGYDDTLDEFEPIEVDTFAQSSDQPVGSASKSRGDTSAKWPEPFPGVMKAAVAAILEVSKKPQPELATMAVLIAMASCCGGLFYSPDGMGLNLYGCNVAPTGAGKDRPHVAACVLAHAGGAKIIGKPVSGEGLEDAVSGGDGTLCEVDEMAHWLAVMNDTNAPAYVRSLAAALLKFFTASVYQTRVRAANKGTAQPRTIENPRLNVLGTTTPEKLGESVTSGNIADGLMGRMLFAFGRDRVQLQRVEVPLRLPQGVLDSAELVRQINDSLEGIAIEHAPGVGEHLHSVAVGFDREASSSESPFAQALFVRAAEKVARIAGVLAVWDTPRSPVIRLDQVDWACAVVRASNDGVLAFAERFMHGGRVQADAAAVLAVLDRITAGELKPQRSVEVAAARVGVATRSMLLRCSKLEKKRFDDAIDHLFALDDIRKIRFPNGVGGEVAALGRRP